MLLGTAAGILGDPGADSGGEGKSKRAEKYGTKKSKERREEPLGTMSYQTSSRTAAAALASDWCQKTFVFFCPILPYFSARLDFPSPPLSAPGSPRMGCRMQLRYSWFQSNFKQLQMCQSLYINYASFSITGLRLVSMPFKELIIQILMEINSSGTQMKQFFFFRATLLILLI